MDPERSAAVRHTCDRLDRVGQCCHDGNAEHGSDSGVALSLPVLGLLDRLSRWAYQSVDAETERVARGIEIDPEGGAGLVLMLGRAESQDARLGSVQIVDNYVQMHLLRDVLAGPDGRSVELDLLEGYAVAVLRANLRPIGRDLDLPVEQGAVERGKGGGVGTVDDDAGETCDCLEGTLRGAGDIGVRMVSRSPAPPTPRCRASAKGPGAPRTSWKEGGSCARNRAAAQAGFRVAVGCFQRAPLPGEPGQPWT